MQTKVALAVVGMAVAVMLVGWLLMRRFREKGFAFNSTLMFLLVGIGFAALMWILPKIGYTPPAAQLAVGGVIWFAVGWVAGMLIDRYANKRYLEGRKNAE